MKVNLVCYEELSSWILGKLTRCLADELRHLNIDVRVGRAADPAADINHHIIYTGFDGSHRTRHTVMITHVDTSDKIELLRTQIERIDMGICLSSDTLEKLVTLGLPRGKLRFVNYPSPQAGKVCTRRVHVGVASRVYSHGSKREYLLGELARHLPADLFTFHIMGNGWEAVVDELRRQGSEVNYLPDFNESRYRELWAKLDYYVYLGQDEGSTGLLDALEAGVPTIATPQGFHLDLPHGITHSVNDFADLRRVFAALGEEKQRLRRSVANISWPNYAQKHVAIWREVLERQVSGSPRSEGDSGLRSPHQVALQWDVPAMPTSAGPGGAAHRPRLLVLTDDPVADVVAAWQDAGSRTHGLPAILCSPLGAPLAPEAFRSVPHLEVRIADQRSFPPEEIPLLSLDFDAVALWNLPPFAPLDALAHPWKPNYIMRSGILERLGRMATTTRFSAASRVFPLVRRLQLRTRTKLVAFMLGDAPYDRLAPAASDPVWQSWWATVEFVAFTDARWNSALGQASVRTCHMRSAPDPWQNVLEMLFKTMARPRDKEDASLPLLRLNKLQRAARRFRPS